LVEHESVEAWIGLPSTAVARLQDTSIHALQVEGETFWATVRDVLPEVDLATRTRTVVLTVTPTAERPQLPTPGQMVRMSLLQSNEQAGYWVPTTALSRGQRGLWALLVVSPDDQTLQKRDVELMQVDSDRTLVRGLIEAGERYVTTGLHRLTPGQQVLVVKR
jgi:multidrug efflux pump subunit AcrA (membrane-fusion protein)